MFIKDNHGKQHNCPPFLRSVDVFLIYRAYVYLATGMKPRVLYQSAFSEVDANVTTQNCYPGVPAKHWKFRLCI